MKKVILALVALAVVALAYITIQSVLAPVNFDKKQAKIEVELQKQLKKIASLEEAYKSVYDKYANAMRDQGLTEEDAARRGLIRRDTVWVAAKDTLLNDGTDLAKLFTIPNNPDSPIQVVASSIEQEVGELKIQMPVFQASASYESYLNPLKNERRVREKVEAAKAKTNAFPGLRVGSLTEAKTNGNWE